jgi:sulfate transport system ATP-binding protein
MSIVLQDLTKRYAGYPVVNRVSLEVADGELFVLLGPSGSGKSTILRMIAGLTPVDEGRVLLHGHDVTALPPQRRDAGFVFQHYALFRYMTVADNVEFALSVRGVARARRRQRRDELLDLAGLSGLGNRMPDQLSGGQQQRVALARALAHEPKVLLLDEPFGALDAKIRTDLRRALKRIQRDLHITTIFVTHDQEEAFELADRLGVMNFGRLLEIGPAEELYQRPQTEFVATFLGTANLLVGQCTPDGVRVGSLHFPLATHALQADNQQRVQVLFRPEDVTLAPDASSLAGPPLAQAEVEQATFAGSFQRLRLRLPPIPGLRAIAPPPPYGSESVALEAVRAPDQALRFPLAPGDHAWVGVRRIHALTHPGLSLLLVAGRDQGTAAALELGGAIARLAHARATILGCGLEPDELQQRVQEMRERLGSGLAALDARAAVAGAAVAVTREIEQRPYDLVVVGGAPARLELVALILAASANHVLLVPQAVPPPTRVLICVAGGEPGKEDVLFAGRLIRHLGAEATLLSVLSPAQDTPGARAQLGPFLEAGTRTLAALGVHAQAKVRTGAPRAEILAELADGHYELLVIGAPLPDRGGRVLLSGLAGQLLSEIRTCPVLIVRSHAGLTPVERLWTRASITEEELA